MKYYHTLVLFFVILSACNTNKPVEETQEHDVRNEEPYRSQFHFTPKSGWMNDPNGMVYYEGEYHLFYQYYPDSTVWGPMHWGHAVSNDMIHWQHLPIALYPDSLGYIFSGSAVVDWKNTSGLGTQDIPPLVAIFTYHDPKGADAGRNDYQAQGIAFSLDKGRSWTKYEHNPVLPNPRIIDFRDPKVAWNEAANQWVMTLAVKDHIEFYSSPDLKNWRKLSEFGKTIGAHGGVWECPDLFSLADDQGTKKWVLFVSINPGGPQGGSATQYFIGDFDEKKFTPQDTVTRWIDHGADNYAGVTWSDIPASDGRRLFLGWMSNWQYAQVVPTQAWRSAMTLPREIELIKSHGTYALKFKPAEEIKTILRSATKFNGSAKLETSLAMISFDLKDDEKEFVFTLSNEKGEKVVVSLKDGVLTFDRSASGIHDFDKTFTNLQKIDMSSIEVRKVNLYIDLASIEIFINDGERVCTNIVFPTQSYDSVKLEKKDPEFSVSVVSSVLNF